MTMITTPRTGVMAALAILLICSGLSQANPIPEELPPINAFSAGIGYAAVAVPHNPSTIYWNPAGIGVAGMLSVDITTSMQEIEGPGSWSFMLANTATTDGARSGMGIIRRSVKRDSLLYKSFQLIAPMAVSLKRGALPVGFSIKYISERLEYSDWKHGIAIDFGMLYRMGGTTFGFVTRNIVASNLQGFRRESWVGAALGDKESAILLAGQVKVVERLSFERINDNYNAGLRLRFNADVPDVYVGRIKRADDRWTTMGFGYDIPESVNRIEYAYSYDPEDKENRVHIITYGFGSHVRKGVQSPGRH